MLEIDALSTAELDALDVAKRLHHLNELYREVKRLGDDKERALDILGDARIALCDDPKDADLKKVKLNAERVLHKLTCSISTRKLQISALQTVINLEARLAR